MAIFRQAGVILDGAAGNSQHELRSRKRYRTTATGWVFDRAGVIVGTDLTSAIVRRGWV